MFDISVFIGMDEAFASYQIIDWILSLVPYIQEVEPWIHVVTEAQFNCPVYCTKDLWLNGYQLSLVPHIQEVEPWIHVVTEAQFNCPVYCTKDVVKWVPIVTGSPHSGSGTLNPCGDRGTIQLPGVLYKRC